MSEFGVDYAWPRPSLQRLRRHGVKFVGRYFSHDPGKDLTPSEYKALKRAGISVIVAWETTANRAAEGKAAGVADALQALARLRRCGMPLTQAVFFAVDFDAGGPEVWEYFRGARSIAGPQTGAYGGYRVVKYLFDNHVISQAWQTYAWSGGLWDRRAGVRQYSNGHTFAGVECDYDVAIRGDYGQGVLVPSHELDALVPAERHRVDRFDRLSVHRRRHPVAWRKVRRELVRKRQEVWIAAVRGLDPRGRLIQRGWGVHDRAARYHLLLERTQ